MLQLPLRWVWVLIALAVLAPACGGGPASTSTGANTWTISIASSNYPTESPSPVLLAGMEQGFFKNHGITVTKVIGSGSGGDSVRSVLQGDLPFGIVGTSAAITAYLSGAPVVIVGGAIQSADNLEFVAKKGSSIKSINDLVGKTAGYTGPGSATDAALRLSLDAAGLTGKVTTKAAGGLSEGLTALQGGGLDVAAITDTVLLTNPSPYEVVWRVGDLVKAFEANVIISSPQLVKSDPKLIKAFLAAWSDSVAWVIANVAKAAASWSAAAKTDPTVITKITQHYADVSLWAPSAQLSQEGLHNVAHSLILLGTVKTYASIPWDKVLNQDFLPDTAKKVDLKALAA